MRTLGNRNKKLKQKIAIMTLLVLSSLNLTIFPKSYPKFITEKDDVLVYTNELTSLYKGSKKISENSDSTSTDIKFEISFNNNSVTNDMDETDSYSIVLPAGCEIYETNVSPFGVLDIENRTITYQLDNGADNETYNNGLSITCPVESVKEIVDNEDRIVINIAIKETINGTEEFYYMDFYYNESLAAYKEKYEEPEESEFIHKKIPMNSDIAYDTFIEWIDKYLTDNLDTLKASPSIPGFTKENIMTYIKEEVFTSKEDIKPGAFPGIVIDTTTDPSNYDLTIKDNFIGYLDNVFRNSDTIVYFSTQKAAEINEAFRYFLENNKDESVRNNANEIIAYINGLTNDLGISDLVLNNTQIPGIIRMSNRQIMLSKRANGLYDIMEYINTGNVKEEVQVPFNSNIIEMYTYFITEARVKYSNIISSNTLNDINNNRLDMALSITKTPENNNNVLFRDYFIHYDQDHYVLFNFYSAGANGAWGYNSAVLTRLDVAQSDVDITFTNAQDQDGHNTLLKINLSGEKEESVSNAIKELEKYFGVTFTGYTIKYNPQSNLYTAGLEYTKVIPTIEGTPINAVGLLPEQEDTSDKEMILDEKSANIDVEMTAKALESKDTKMDDDQTDEEDQKIQDQSLETRETEEVLTPGRITVDPLPPSDNLGQNGTNELDPINLLLE